MKLSLPSGCLAELAGTLQPDTVACDHDGHQLSWNLPSSISGHGVHVPDAAQTTDQRTPVPHECFSHLFSRSRAFRLINTLAIQVEMFFKLRCFKGGVASQPVAAERATTRLTAPHTARWTHELSLSPSASLSRSLSASTPAYATPACHATPSLLACHTTPSLLACAMRCDSATPRLLQRRAVGGPHANLSANAFWQLPSIAMGALSFLLPLALVCGLRSQVSPLEDSLVPRSSFSLAGRAAPAVVRNSALVFH